MMYDELVKRLRNCATEAAPCNTCDMIHDISCSNTLMKQAADAIEVLSKKETTTPRWISVEERLPIHDMNVLICYEWTGRSGTVYREVGIASIEELERDPTEMFRPIAWMALPEPPKEET